VRHGRWYLLCWSHASAARRAYRIDRVRGIEVLDHTFSQPADLDPVAMLEEHLAVGWEYDIEIVIHAPVDNVAACAVRAMGRLESLDAETTRVVGSTSNPFRTPSNSPRSRRPTGSWVAPSCERRRASSGDGCWRRAKRTRAAPRRTP
jgi:hypothetical protein